MTEQCQNCNGNIESDFEYCPHCGERIVTSEIENYLDEFTDHTLHEHCSWRKIKSTEYYLEIPHKKKAIGTVSFGTNLPEPWKINNVWVSSNEETLVSIVNTKEHFSYNDD